MSTRGDLPVNRCGHGPGMLPPALDERWRRSQRGGRISASERERHELAAKLEELLGPDQAATLMEHLTEAMELRFESLGDRITAHIAERADTQTKLLVFSLLGAVLTATAIALGANVLRPDVPDAHALLGRRDGLRRRAPDDRRRRDRGSPRRRSRDRLRRGARLRGA